MLTRIALDHRKPHRLNIILDTVKIHREQPSHDPAPGEQKGPTASST
ncbi:hypothetical protein CGMCC3_g3472 [Colletotrichum fructicola]|nr:uncharacterized protein CGMCC3_g3472 [Colletotrichum fructicola]KAE9580435.1 hypothetical protein CGMCC3_g3472 [Colletotrichum fructicola]